MKLKSFAQVLWGSLALTAASHALTVNVSAVAGTAQNTSGLDTFTTTGETMAGMSVTVTFSDGSTETVAWAHTGAVGSESGAATGTGFSITETGTTYSNTWTVSNSSMLAITRIAFDGAPGDTMFDRTRPSLGTTDSAQGRDFVVSASNQGSLSSTETLTAVYSDVIGVGGNPPVTDLYRRLTVDFDLGLVGGGSFGFRADTDNAALENDIKPVPDGGSTLVLLSLGLVGLLRGKKFRK